MITLRPNHDALLPGARVSAGPERWAIVLAGGDGVRLRELTRQIAGDDRPKQFCALVGEESLLADTRRRVARGVSPDRTVFSVTSAHEPFYAPLRASVPSRRIVEQPANRGTAPAILYALLRVAAVAPAASVGLFPSDHFVVDDAAFMAHATAAFALVTARPDRIALLGITPDRPETEYGWIEPAEPLAGPGEWPAYHVRGFWEKPAPALAQALFDAGCLWNSFVVVGRVSRLLDLVARTCPGLSQAFHPLRRFIGTPVEAAVAQAVYHRLPAVDFSRSVLGPSAADLAVLPVRGVEWSDLGNVDRVLALRGRVGARGAGRLPPVLAPAASR